MDTPNQPKDDRDDESRADVAERDQPAAPPASGTGKGGKPKVNASGVPEVVPGPPHDGSREAADR